ncbi:3-hydroxyisobutyrate dehydrogenase-like beta-hydroxyacid dehydrogenase [Nocardia transvalensis]|uniref:3-hydroxyisobutyrate dehydrogenase-like beta-hydroxyacid dehydrogenase n=1 Tax=Nocardia transvalensis TaxID=37333 RepID=A0A7W9PDA3_9NOCA|nr:NAD(P)-binding domain-containing protein [Nocardia transvalensis]MBB5914004.1 3-hydroxyisobutyrate dehydrogenase-like beta-hydroxyacid dehydrogenase [Nocardia transvalensis]
MSQQSRSVTVLGLGPMGQAMVKQFLAAGVEVTVWNRSPEKAETMAALGAVRAATVAEALDANAVTVVSLTHYDAMYDVLGPATDRLAGKVIVNLSSDSPEKARAGAAWVRSHGAQFLSGGFMSAGDNITHPASYIFYSGPREVFDAHAELLRPLSPQEYVGADDGVAQVFYQALLIVFHPWMLAFDQALAVIQRSGHDIGKFLPYAQRSSEAFPFFMAEYAAAAQAGGWGDISAFRMMDAGAQHIIDASEEVGVDATLSHTAQGFWRKAVAASEESGRAVSIFELMRGSAA